MMQLTRESLAADGFQGFVSIGQLKSSSCGCVPRQMGVYAVLRKTTDAPVFRTVSIGGHFKGKDPTVPGHALTANWVDGAAVVYIGKAGGSSSKSTLQSRLGQYIAFGCGMPVGHWGGRLIWQLADADELLVAWRVITDAEPIKEEQRLIDGFKARYGRYPFANMRR